MKVELFDLEADGLLGEATKVWCGTFKNLRTGSVVSFYPGSHDNWEEQMLSHMDQCDVLIAHNGIGYDFPLLEKIYGYNYQGKKVDTLIVSRLHQPNRLRPFGYEGKGGPHSIEAWGYRVGRWKPDHEDWSQFSMEMLHRNQEDVEILHLVYNELVQEGKDLGGNWKAAYNTSFRLFEILQKQEEYGWLVDQQRLDKGIHMLQHWMGRLERILSLSMPLILEIKENKVKGELGHVKKPFLKSGKPNQHMINYWGEDVNLLGGPHSRVSFRRMEVTDRKKVKQFLLDSGWKPLAWNTDSDGNQTSPKMSKDDPFDGIEGMAGKLVAKHAQCQHRLSLLQGWRDRLRPDGRLPSRVTGLAATGRATHSEIVNVPNSEAFFGPYIRSIFICSPGKVLVGTDAKGCQDRRLCDRAKDQAFADMMLKGTKEDGTDSHSVAAKAINEVFKRRGLPLITRQKAKNYNYAFKFGASNNKLGRMAGAGEDVGLEIRDALNNVFHAMASVTAELTEEWESHAISKKTNWGVQKSNGWFSGIDGRPIYVESPHAILVYCLQSDEALLMSNAYVLLYERLLELGYKWGVDWAYVTWQHDEFQIECREELAEEIGTLAAKTIEDVGEMFKFDFCKQEGDYEIGFNWRDTH